MTDRMREVSHTHPDHDTTDWHYFHRGPTVAADGGRRETEDGREERDIDRETMEDVSHTPPHGDGADRVWDGTHVYERDPDGERVQAGKDDE